MRLFEQKEIYIVAEIGGNFTTFEEARDLIDAAAACGVDAVKLQTYRAETVASKIALFDMENTGVTSQFDLFTRYQIDEELHRKVFEYIAQKELDWFSTPSHPTDVDLLERLGVEIYKIGSDDAVNLPLLRYVADKNKPILLATGMCTLDEVELAVQAILERGNKQLVLLHAVTSYPTHPEHVNLRAMQTLAQKFGLPVGYSDHSLGTTACLGAAALGATVLEKHFTLDKNADGPDHMISADFCEMKSLVQQVRILETMLGTGFKVPAQSEFTTRHNNRKSVVIARDLPAGHKLAPEDLTIKRPGYGIEPRFLEQVAGATLTAPVKADEVLRWELIQR